MNGRGGLVGLTLLALLVVVLASVSGVHGQVPQESSLANEWPTGWPQTAAEFLAWVTAGQPVPDGTWMPIELGEIHQPPGEPYAWVVAREKDMSGYITPFWVRNPSGCMQDGWMHHKADRDAYGRTYPPEAVGSGIPNQDVWVGLAEGFTFRPCTGSVVFLPLIVNGKTQPVEWPQTAE